MLIGHYGVAFALKPAEPRVSLGVLFVATQFVDMLWIVLVLIGVEKAHLAPAGSANAPLEFTYYPWSHSLLMSCVWALAAFLLVRLLPIYKGPRHTRAALIVAACVLSHWFLDLPMHRADLPIGFHGPYVGFGLWDYPALSLVLETVVLFAGFWIYRWKAQRPNYLLLVLALFLFVVQIINTYGPPAQNVAALASSGLAFYVFVAAVAWWLDRPPTADKGARAES
jgi:hypothetical protein